MKEININFNSKNNLEMLHEPGYRKDAAMSQYGITEAITQLKDENHKSYTGLETNIHTIAAELAEIASRTELYPIVFSELYRLMFDERLVPGARYVVVDYCCSNYNTDKMPPDMIMDRIRRPMMLTPVVKP